MISGTGITKVGVAVNMLDLQDSSIVNTKIDKTKYFFIRLFSYEIASVFEWRTNGLR